MASTIKYNLVLASQSPRRRELLGWIDVPFKIQPSQVEEVSDSNDPVEVAKDIAALKGRDVWDNWDFNLAGNPLIVASDTLVELNGKIYGKPKNKEEARQMLKELAGNTHRVVTAVFFKAKDNKNEKIKEHCFAVQTQVTFSAIHDDILAPYIESGESMDKAGAYGIQSKGLTFVEHLEGSYSNVVGFPLVEFLKELKTFLNLENDAIQWREAFEL